MSDASPQGLAQYLEESLQSALTQADAKDVLVGHLEQEASSEAKRFHSKGLGYFEKVVGASVAATKGMKVPKDGGEARNQILSKLSHDISTRLSSNFADYTIKEMKTEGEDLKEGKVHHFHGEMKHDSQVEHKQEFVVKYGGAEVAKVSLSLSLHVTIAMRKMSFSIVRAPSLGRGTLSIGGGELTIKLLAQGKKSLAERTFQMPGTLSL